VNYIILTYITLNKSDQPINHLIMGDSNLWATVGGFRMVDFLTIFFFFFRIAFIVL